MLLKHLQKRTQLVNSVATRSMGIKPKKQLETELEQKRQGALEYASTKKRKFINEIDPPVISQKEAERILEGYKDLTPTAADKAKYTKPGDQERTDFYSKISEIQEGDHQVIKKVKKNIKKLLDQELEFLGFCDGLDKAEEKELIEGTYKDIEVRKSFFFKYDNKKRDWNKKIYDVQAPGNIHRKINYIVPHEHIHPQHHIDVASLTEDDIQQLYAYYTLYIDFHIGQIRRDVKEHRYIPPQFAQLGLRNDTELTEYAIDNKFIEYYYHWREPTRTWRSQTQEIDYQKELEALPINKHPAPGAFSKNEVEWTEDQKFPHVANRLGYPIMAESPIERIVGIERAPAHPSYQFQAFVQTPSMDPDPSLNFEIADTVYENKRVGEWVRMWKWLLTCTLPFWPAFYTFEIYQGDGAPSLDWLSNAGSWHKIPKQMQDSGNWNLYNTRYCDEHDYMNIHYAFKRSILRPMHTFYQLVLFGLLNGMNFGYVTRMSYNKDRDLVFVNKADGWFTEKEYIYEVHHLESMVPGTVNAYQHLGVGHKDGVTTLMCMDTKQPLKFYNDPKYWNIELKDDFLSQTRSMWPDL